MKDESKYFDKYSSIYLKYGPWAIVTGAASSLGKEFCRKLAEQGFNLVLVSRRNYVIEDVATDLMSRYGIQTLEVSIDMKNPGAMKELSKKTCHLEIGLYVCGAGFSSSFNKDKIYSEIEQLESNSLSLLTKIWDDSGSKSKHCRAGLILMNSFMERKARDTRSYVDSLSIVLNQNLSPYGIDVVAASPTSSFKKLKPSQMDWHYLKGPVDIVESALKAIQKKKSAQMHWIEKLWMGSFRNLPDWAKQMVRQDIQSALN